MGTTLEDEDLTRDKYRASVQKMGFLLNYRYRKNDFNFFLWEDIFSGASK